MKLQRFAYSDLGTFGRLLLPSFSCYTVERPWLNNRPFVSCVPEGTYRLEPRRYNRGGYETLEITGVPNRSLILIHKGNLPRHVQGCVAVGRRLGCLEGTWSVLESAQAFAAFWAAVQDAQPAEITIEREPI